MLLNPYFHAPPPAGIPTFHTSTAILNGNLVIPATVLAGDLLVGWEISASGAVVLPTGFTEIVSGIIASAPAIAYYRIAQAGDEGDTIVGLAGTMRKTLAVFRRNPIITSVTVHDVDFLGTSANPPAQTITAGGGTPPLIVLGFYGLVQSTTTVAGLLFSPTQDAFLGSVSNRMAYRIYGSAPANTTIDQNDGGINFMASCYIQVPAP